MAEEAVLMDEIDVLLRVMRDNLTPSYVTSETQVRGGRLLHCVANLLAILE